MLFLYPVNSKFMKKPNPVFRLFLVAIVVLSVIVSCKKSSNDSNAITKENLAGTYTLTGLTATVAPLPAQDIIDSVPACQRDDQYVLHTDLTFDYVDAGTKCTPAGDNTSTWSLSGKTIMIDTLQGTIQHFDGKALVINHDETIQGFSAVITTTFTKQ